MNKRSGKEQKVLDRISELTKQKDNIERKIKELRVELRRIKTDEAWNNVVIKRDQRKAKI